MPDEMTLPITPQTFWFTTVLAAILVLSALIYWMLRAMGQERRPPLWEELPERMQGVTVVLCLLWLGLFVLTIVAAYLGVWEAIRPKDAGSQPNLGLGALLAALLGSPFVIWGTWLKYQTVRTQQEGHMTDRISKAVEQLGAEKTVKAQGKDSDGKDVTFEETKPNIEVRVGAILSLERIAQDSTKHDKGRDHVRVMEILCAYVRENARVTSLDRTQPDQPFRSPRIDLQTAMTVIKRRHSNQIAVEVAERYRLDLRACDFRMMDLSKGNFAGAMLWRSNFEAATLDNSDLTGTQFYGSLLNYARWWDAELMGTRLDHCILDRPERVAGRMNMHAPHTGKTFGVSVVGADLTAMDYFGQSAEAFFGSKDTKLDFHQEELRKDAAENYQLRQRAERLGQKDTVMEIDGVLKENPFKNWSPYDANDGATNHYLKKYHEQHGLVGWPYSD